MLVTEIFPIHLKMTGSCQSALCVCNMVVIFNKAETYGNEHRT